MAKFKVQVVKLYTQSYIIDAPSGPTAVKILHDSGLQMGTPIGGLTYMNLSAPDSWLWSRFIPMEKRF